MLSDSHIREALLEALEKQKCILCSDTSMHLDMICEELCQKTGEEAFTFYARSIYYGDRRVASIEVSVEGKRCVGIYRYKILIKGGKTA